MQRAAFELQLEPIPEVHIVSATPETEFEVLGDREITNFLGAKVGQTGQVTSEAAMGAKALSYEANVKFVDVHARSSEYVKSTSATIKDRPTIPRIICDAVGSTAHWDFYMTPNYALTGSVAYEARVLVSRTLRTVAAKSFLTATFASWGPLETRTSAMLDLVFQE